MWELKLLMLLEVNVLKAEVFLKDIQSVINEPLATWVKAKLKLNFWHKINDVCCNFFLVFTVPLHFSGKLLYVFELPLILLTDISELHQNDLESLYGYNKQIIFSKLIPVIITEAFRFVAAGKNPNKSNLVSLIWG